MSTHLRFTACLVLVGWCWRAGTVAGLPIRVHWSFWLVPALLAADGIGRRGGDWLALAYLVGLHVALGASIVLHELGHAWSARRSGVRLGEIVLALPGGLLTGAFLPGRLRPRQEIRLALAGPAVSLALALLLAALGWGLAGRPAWPGELTRLLWRMSPGGFAATLGLANVGLALVNLLPIFPLDGGRLLRGLLSLRGDVVLATRLTCGLSLLLTPAVLGVGLWLGVPALLALATMAVVGSWQEIRLLDALLRDARWRGRLIGDRPGVRQRSACRR